MSLKSFLTSIFTWWNGATVGTLFHTWRHGELVGTDEFGNRYYRTRGGAVDPALGFQRRWVIYNGEAESSRQPPGWRAWISHTTNVAPSEENYVPREWEKPYEPNQTGTARAYRPRGSVLGENQRPAATGDYVAWTPGE